MEHFSPNPNLYTIKPESFTSDDEFIANKRVHITNEIPPEDLYDKVHSKLKNDFWQWFLGSTKLSFASDGITYNLDTNGMELFDSENNILEPSIAKYINGNRAKDYGPIPKLQYNSSTDNYDLINQEYNRFEVEGTMMPEFDFLLHEGYRYLDTLYPDHPDYTEILTNNELNDDLVHAATIVNYHPNITFFDWLSKQFEYDKISETELGWIQNKEAFKLKIRNLKNNTFRRKLYGSKSGYNMFGSEIFQHMMIYPIAEYLPFLPKPIPNYNMNYSEGHKKFVWFRDIYNQPSDFKNDDINKYSRLYKRAFRLVDWDNSSFDYEHEYVPPSVVYGTAYPTPLSNYDIYEWPIDRDWKTINGEPISYVAPSIEKDFYEGQKIKIKDKTTVDGFRYVYINAIFAEETYRVQAYLNYDHNEFLNRITTIPESITRVQIDGPAYPIYTLFDVYPSVEKTLQTILDNNKAVREAYQKEYSSWSWGGKIADQFINTDSEEYAWLTTKKLTYYNLTSYEAICNDDIDNTLIRSIRELYKLLDLHKQVKFTLEPHQDGNLFIPAQYLMTCYENWLKVSIDKTDKKNPVLKWKPTGMSNDAYINISDLIIKNLNNESYVSEIVGLEGGILKFEISDSEPFSQSQKILIDTLNKEEIGKYGIVIQFHKNNEVSAGKLAVVFGKPIVTYSDPDKNNNYHVLNIDLELQAIPKIKSHELMLALYENYEAICKSKFTNLEVLFEIGDSLEDDNLYKNYYKRYNNINTYLTTLLDAFEVLISQNKDGLVHVNDTYWNNVKRPFINIIENYDLRSTLYDQIKEKYEDFVKDTDIIETILDIDQFEENCRNIINELHTYNSVYFSWIYDIVSIDLDREYYENLDENRLRDFEKIALKRVKTYDLTLNDMLVNRAYLLKPLPSDLWMKEVDDGESSYSLLYRQDIFVSLLEYSIDEYKDLFKFIKNPIYGTNGILTDFKFGSLNTAIVVNNDEDQVKVPWEYFASTDYYIDSYNGEQYGNNYLKTYNLEDYKYWTLNKDILLSVELNSNIKKFSYATPLFLELFLPQAGINNLSGEIIPPYKVEIRSFITKDSNIISFIDEESIARLACISTGDKVIGNGVEDDIFVDYIDYEKNQIRVKKTNLDLGEADFTFEFTDDLVLTYLCKMNLYAKDTSKDFFKYREELSKNKLLDFGSIFAHGPFDQYSNTYLNGMIDVSHFVNTYKTNLKDQSIFKQYFNKFVWDLYNNGEDAAEYFVIPSIINCVNKLYVEIGAYKRYDITEFNKVTQSYEEKYYTDQYLMKKEILDYFQDSLSEISKGSDLVNLGINVIAATKNDGLVSQIPDEEFTDPKIKLKFATYNWSSESVPYYIDIGIGELKSFWNRGKQEFEDQKRLYQDHSYYNYDVYGSKDSESSDVGRWTSQEFSVINLYDLPVIDRIDKPIMRVYLGEYEVQKLISFDPTSLNKYTTVQFSIIKQIFKNLERKDSSELAILNDNYFNYDIFKNITSFNEGYTENGVTTTFFDKSEFKNYYYLGIWKPSKNIINNKIIYPDKIADSFNVIYYYTIAEDITLMNCDIGGQLENVTFNAGTVLLLINNEWEYKEFIFTGLLGNTNILKANLNLLDNEEVTITYSQPPEYSSIGKNQDNWLCDNGSKNLTLRHRLLFKLVRSLKVLSGSDTILLKLSAQELEEIFDWTIYELNENNVLNYITEHFSTQIANEIQDQAIAENKLKIRCFYEKRIQSELLDNLPDEFINVFNLSYDNIFWFLYTVGDKRAEGYTPTSWQLFEEKTSIVPGTVFALVPVNKQFKIIILNENEFLFKINSNNTIINTNYLIDRYEFNTFIGYYGHQNNLITQKLFLYEKLDQYQNNINVSYKYLLEGSLNIKFDIHPNFLTYGWTYNEDGSLKEEIDNVDLTEENIYYDEINNKLYTYNTLDGVKTKLAIKQEEHKFFKNLLFIYGSYNMSTIIQNNKYIQVPEISQIEGIKFDAEYLSLLDRILSIEQINIRSLYDMNLESTIFSSYCDIRGILKGIFVDKDTKKNFLNISYEDAEEPKLTSNKLKFTTELLKILPTREDGDLQEDELYFDYNDERYNAKWLDTNEKIISPEVKNFNVTKLISNVESEKIFSYYKNTLVLEGEIDLSTPNQISFQKNPRLKDALSYLRIDDEIQDIYFIENSVQDQFVPIWFSGFVMKFFDYRQDKLLVANSGYFLFSNLYKTIGSIPTADFDKDGVLFGNQISGTMTNIGKNGIPYTSLDSIAYEKHNNRWLLSLSNTDNANQYSDIISISLDNNENADYNLCYNTTGIDINTYQPISIMETNDPRTEDELLESFKGLNLSSSEIEAIKETYEFNKILDNQISGLILARDIAIINAEILSGDIINFNSMVDKNNNSLIENYMTSNDDYVYYDENTGYIFGSKGHEAIRSGEPIHDNLVDGTLEANGGGIWKTKGIKVKKDEYKIVSLSVQKLMSDPFSDTSLSVGCYDGVLQMLIYDKIIEKWTIASVTDYTYNFLVGYNIPYTTNIICYLIGENYGIDATNGDPTSNNTQLINFGMSRWRLPKPEVTDNKVICAFIINNGKEAKIKITINKGLNGILGQFSISNFKIKSPDKLNEDFGFYEAPYNPLATIEKNENAQEKFVAKKWVANNDLDNEAIVIGSTLFLYTPTKTYDKIESMQNGQLISGYIIGKLTENNHWKRADLPSETNITYQLFDEIEKTFRSTKPTFGTLSDGLLQVYDLVYSNYEYIRTLLKGKIESLGSSSIGFENAELEAFKVISGWIENNPPKQYTTEESIPITIKHEGIELFYTENGRIPNFIDSGIIRWDASQDAYIELGITYTVHLKNQNYLRYLADYSSIILGSQRFKSFFSKDNIKDMILTNTDLIFHTVLDDLIILPLDYSHSRDDIEDYNHWNITNIGEEYVFSSNLQGQFVQRTVGISGVYTTIEQFPVIETNKAFTILEKFISNNIHIYVGYIQVNEAVIGVREAAFNAEKFEDVLYLTKLFPNNRNKNLEASDSTWNFSKAMYPIIFYSQNNGKNFSKFIIPANADLTDLRNNLSDFSLINPGDEQNNPDYQFCQIYQIGPELRIVLRRRNRHTTDLPWENVGYVSCYIQNNKNTTEILFNDNITVLETDDQNNRQLKIIRNKELFANNKVFYVSENGMTANLKDSDKNADYFFLKKPFSFSNLNKPKITQVDDSSITFNYTSDLDLESEFLRVLVSINPYNLLENNTTYLEYKTEYLNSFGDFAVPTFIEVDNIHLANRLYSLRECMTAGPINDDILYSRNQIPKKGIPAISEDIEKNVYQYYSPFINSKGETITNYIEATNTAGQIVKLCRLNGEYLTSRDSPTNNNYFTWASMIINNISYESLIAAPLLQDDYEATIQDEDLNTILKDTLNRKVTVDYLNFTNNNPQLTLDIFEIDKNVIAKLASPLNEETGLYDTSNSKFYKLPPKNALKDINAGLEDMMMYKVDYNKTEAKDFFDWATLREKIEAIDGPFDPINKQISSRFSSKLIEDYNGQSQEVFFDNFTNTIILKEQNTIDINFNIPYIFKNGQQVYNNYLFDFNKNGHILNRFEESYPITSVYIPSKGYGGSLNNGSWDAIRPEENDYQAFDYDENKNPYLSLNDENDYVYLSDSSGVKLQSRNGLFWLETEEQIELSYNKLFAEKQSVKFYPLKDTEHDYNNYQNEPSEYYFYKLPLTPISVYVPKRILDEDNIECGKVWLNNPCLRDNNNVAIKTADKKYQIPVTIFKLNKAGYSEDINNYNFEFYNYNETSKLDFIYDYDKQMILYLIDDDDGFIEKNIDTTEIINGVYNKNYMRPIKYIPEIREKIIVKITHKETNQKTKYDLYIQDGYEQGFLLSIDEVLFNNEEFLQEKRNINLLFDKLSFVKAGLTDYSRLYSNDQSIVLENSVLNTEKLVLEFKEYPTLHYIIFNEEQLYIDVRNYNISVLVNKDWITSTDKIINYSLYTGDQLLQKETQAVEVPTLENVFEVSYGNSLYSALLTPDVKELTLFNIDNNIFTWNEVDIVTEKKFSYYIVNGKHYFSTEVPIGFDTGKTDSKVLISGLPGNIIFNYPTYRNFKELIDNKLQIIEYKTRKMLAVHPMNNMITDIDPNYISFKLENEVPNIDLNNPYLKIKIMPVQTVYPEIRYLNNDDYIQEVDIQEKDIYGYDRVWINENLCSNPPIIYRNFLYNESSDYFTNAWRNKDDYLIYLSNQYGKFVRPALINGVLKFVQLDEELNDGDCRPYIYGTVDPRFNPPELILKTSIEKYLNNFYIKGLEINPLVLTLNIKDEYNAITQKFDKITNIYSKQKSNNTIEYVPVKDSYITEISQNLIYDISDKIYQNQYDDFFDYENGLVKFKLRGPSKEYKLTESKYFYGINYYVDSKTNDLLNNLITKFTVKNDIRSDFYINTKEDLTDKKNKDHAIVEITEIGLFDKYNHLCAYLSHPKVQYRSDSTHLSYSLIIDEGGK